MSGKDQHAAARADSAGGANRASAASRIVTREMWLELADYVPDAALDIDALRERFAAVERIYCGSDTCVREFEAAVDRFAQLQRIGKELTLVVPPLPERLFPLLEDFLHALSSNDPFPPIRQRNDFLSPLCHCEEQRSCDVAIQSANNKSGDIAPTSLPPEPLELCVNDLGILTRAAAVLRTLGTPRAFRVTIGRWLARQDTDPQLAVFCDEERSLRVQPERFVTEDGEVKRLCYRPPGAELQLHWNTPSIFGASTLKVFRRLLGTDALRVELDQQQGLPPLPAGVEVSLYTEGRLISMLPCRTCDGCSAEARILGIDRFGTPLFRKRNAILSTFPL